MEQTIKTNVGLDLSKDTFWLSLGVLTSNYDLKFIKDQKFNNRKEGFDQMLNCIKRTNVNIEGIHFTMEATGVYYENLANYLYQKGFNVHVVLPNKAKKFAESLDIKSKTDKLDSKFLSRLGLERKLINWAPPEPIYKELKELTRERARLVKIRSQFKNTLHALNYSYKAGLKTVNRTESIIKLFDKKVKQIESEIALKVKSNQNVTNNVNKLISIPGVGEITAVTIIAETNGFSMITNARQLTSYAGLDIRIRESGKWKGKEKISKKGNSHIRGALYLPALCIINNSEQMKSFYSRLVQEKKKSKIGITAVCRKLLLLMYSIWKNDSVYDKSYNNKNAA